MEREESPYVPSSRAARGCLYLSIGKRRVTPAFSAESRSYRPTVEINRPVPPRKKNANVRRLLHALRHRVGRTLDAHFPHRARAALRAISLRCSAVNETIRALRLALPAF